MHHVAASHRLPGVSVPCGFTKSGLPIGMQLVGRHFDEATLVRIGHAYQNATDWHTRRPPPPATGASASRPLRLHRLPAVFVLLHEDLVVFLVALEQEVRHRVRDPVVVASLSETKRATS